MNIFDSFGFLVEIIKWISKYKFLHISKRVHVVLLRLKFIHCLYSELLQLLACTLVLGSTYICIWSLVFSFQRRPKLQYLYICIENWMLYKLIARSFCSSRKVHYLHEYYITQSSKSFQCKWVKYLLWISIIFTHVCLSKNSLREKSNLLCVMQSEL